MVVLLYARKASALFPDLMNRESAELAETDTAVNIAV